MDSMTTTFANLCKDEPATKLMHRPGFIKAGKEVTLALNSYNVLAKPTKNVYQYDVSSAIRIRYRVLIVARSSLAKAMRSVV